MTNSDLAFLKKENFPDYRRRRRRRPLREAAVLVCAI